MSHLSDPVSIAIQSTYTTVSAGLFVGSRCVDAITTGHKEACTTLLGSIDTLLIRHQMTLTNLTFIAVNQGPGPYTTLRITLATADGLSFATGIPLVGVDGFAAFIDEINDKSCDITIILLNAFCREVFYAFYDNADNSMTTGYLPIDELIEKVEALGNKKILIAGNGVPLFAHELTRISTPTLIHATPFKEAPSLEAIGKAAYKKWLSGSGTSKHLLPLYLKKPAYRIVDHHSCPHSDPSTSSG